MEQTITNAERFIHEKEPLINNRYRAGFHAMPPVGWINDPNGFCFYKGLYHLFCQFNPYDSKWGPMHWGHWTSSDLLTWDWVGVALAPDMVYDRKGVFSGTALVEDDKLILMYTGVSEDAEGKELQQQCIAFSDDGLHFQKAKENPVIRSDQLPKDADFRNFRDPKLLRINGTYWAIVANRSESGGYLTAFYSTDMVHWTLKGTFCRNLGSMLECPDLHPIDESLDALLTCVMEPEIEYADVGSDNQPLCLLGHADIANSKFDIQDVIPLDFGRHLYAPQAMDDPALGTVMVGWLPGWNVKIPTDYLNHGWAGYMSLPRILKIQNNKLIQQPLPALRSRRKDSQTCTACLNDNEMLSGKHEQMAEIEMEMKPVGPVEIQIMSAEDEKILLKYDPETEMLKVNSDTSGYSMFSNKEKTETLVPFDDGKIKLDILIDVAIAEIFINDGEKVLTVLSYSKQKDHKWSVRAVAGCELTVRVWPL